MTSSVELPRRPVMIPLSHQTVTLRIPSTHPLHPPNPALSRVTETRAVITKTFTPKTGAKVFVIMEVTGAPGARKTRSGA
jgi:hypothetical protein